MFGKKGVAQDGEPSWAYSKKFQCRRRHRCRLGRYFRPETRSPQAYFDKCPLQGHLIRKSPTSKSFACGALGKVQDLALQWQKGGSAFMPRGNDYPLGFAVAAGCQTGAECWEGQRCGCKPTNNRCKTPASNVASHMPNANALCQKISFLKGKPLKKQAMQEVLK